MAIFTTELGTLIGTGFDIGLRDYPIHDERYRSTLNDLITEHFFFREIGLETPALFKRFLNRKMAEIMPYYNELFKSQLISFDPLYNVNITTHATTDVTNDQTATTHRDESVNAAANGTSADTANSRSVFSQTPQTQLAGNEDYATNLTDATSAGTGETSSTQESASVIDETADTGATSLTDYVNTVSGYSGQHPAAAIMEFRQSLINVNLMILDELETLFMGIWSNEVNGL